MGTKVKVKLEVVDRFSELGLLAGTEEEQRAMLHAYAHDELKKASAQNKQVLGYAPDYETRVDGAPAVIERAKSTSIIEIEFELASTMYQWIHDMLVLNSPVGQPTDPRPGHPELYAKSHTFFVDGNEMDPDGPVPPHDEAVFVNTQPYARKLERGLSAQAESIYETVAYLARQKFGNFARITFSHRTPYNFGAIHEWANTTSMQSPGRRGEKREEWLRRQPAIVIRP